MLYVDPNHPQFSLLTFPGHVPTPNTHQEFFSLWQSMFLKTSPCNVIPPFNTDVPSAAIFTYVEPSCHSPGVFLTDILSFLKS